MKPYLLIAGNEYYPGADTDDWIGCFKTIEKAEECLDEMRKLRRNVDWHTIVDLRSWMHDDGEDEQSE